MAIAFRNSNTATGTGTSIAVTKPTGTAVDDILVFVIDNDHNSSGITFPTGFTAITGSPLTLTHDGERLHCAIKKADGTEGATLTATATVGVGGGWAASLRAYSGCDTTTWLDATPTAGSSNAANASPVTVTAPTITTTTANAMVLFIAGSDDDGVVPSSWSTPTSHSNVDTALQLWSSVLVADRVFAGTGATGTATSTLTLPSGTSGWGAFRVALRPAVSGAIAGTSTLTFGQTGAATGDGALAGTSATNFGQTGLLAGAGALAGTSAVVFAPTGTLTSAGALAGTAALSFDQTGALTGVGALAGTISITFDGRATADIPASTVTSYSGGFFYQLDGYGARRKRELKRQREAEAEAQAIQDELDRQIAVLLREQEAKDAERHELERLRALAQAYAPTAHTDIDNERVLAALAKATQAQSLAAFEALSREIERMNDEEDFAVLQMLIDD